MCYILQKQETTGFSPFYLLYGRHPRLPLDFEFGSTADAVVTQDRASMPHEKRLEHDLRNARDLVISRINNSQLKSKERFDKKRIFKKFEKGDLVLLYKPWRKPGTVEKLLHRWLGPYVVEAVLSEVNYEVRLATGRKKKPECMSRSSRNFTLGIVWSQFNDEYKLAKEFHLF